MTKRAYDNTGRAQQSLQTRATIVEVMIDLMARGGEDVPVAEVARLAGVSVRTVYQHLPDKAARIEAINDWIEERVDTGAVLPVGFEDIPGYVERLIDYIVRHEKLMRVQMAPGLSKQVRTYRKQRHVNALRDALSERITDRNTVDELTGLLISSVRVEAIFDMRDIYGLAVPRIKSRVKSMVEALLAAELASS